MERIFIQNHQDLFFFFFLFVSCRRNTDSDYSDGEEDFYYTEVEVNMDSLTEGLSSLTPTSPTTTGPPPIFPPPLSDPSHSEHISMNGFQSHAPSLLSQSAPSTLCHIRTDHAYQVIQASPKNRSGLLHVDSCLVNILLMLCTWGGQRSKRTRLDWNSSCL